jgi:multiple antibiotic resistance protein
MLLDFSLLLSFIKDLVKVTIALLIIVDPWGNIPISISLTRNMSGLERKNTFNNATIVGFILLICFAIAGQQILSFFGISVYSFMVAGGLLLFIIAVRLLITGGWDENSSSDTIGAVPIGIPLLVGPGAITATILNLHTYGAILTILAVVITFAIVWIILRCSNPIYRILGKNGTLVISKLMALFIAAIAVQYIQEGIFGLLLQI